MLWFDIETDGLLSNCTKIHSLVIIDKNGKMFSCADQEGYTPIDRGLEMLANATTLVAHNGIDFDLRALDKITSSGNLFFRKPIIDTLNLSRLVYPDIGTADIVKFRHIPKGMVGRHSLEAWGHRLHCNKWEFGKDTNWNEWSKEMQDYCEQDVILLKKLYEHLHPQTSAESIDLEMEFQKRITKQNETGFPFNIEKAKALNEQLLKDAEGIKEELAKFVTHTEKKEVFIPKVDNEAKGYKAGCPIVRIKKLPFNYNSRDQIVKYFKDTHKWHPVDYTEKGRPQLSAEILAALPWEEAKLFSKLFDISKILGRLSSTDSSWLSLAKDGRLYGGMITNGAVTGRCTHQIIANIPAVRSYLGKEVRELFQSEGWQVGCDAKGLELRILAHYMAAYDNGDYAKRVVEGDIHTDNQKAAGLATRDAAKTFIYAFLYGAGDPRLGAQLDPTATSEKQKALGKKMREKFLAGFPALDRLLKVAKSTAKTRGFLYGIDGRRLPIRAVHSSLNTLLQSCGALAMKKACLIAWDLFDECGLVEGRDVTQLIHYHDEMQFDCKDEATAQLVGKLVAKAITKAGEYYKLKCPLEGDYKIGRNWYECH